MTDADFSSIDAAQPEASTALEQAASHAHICSKLAEQYKSNPVLFAALTDAAAILRDLMRGLGDWVLVPRVPTDAMLRAAQGAWLNDPLRRTTTMWAAMLAAAPQQPAAVDGAIDKARFERAPCYLCGYNGPGYYRPDTHPCAAKYHAAQEELHLAEVRVRELARKMFGGGDVR